MSRAMVAHVREHATVPVLLNVKHELVQIGVDWFDATFREHAVGVLRNGGQVLRLPRDVVRQLRMWDRVEILQIGVTAAVTDARERAIPIPHAGESAGSPFD